MKNFLLIVGLLIITNSLYSQDNTNYLKCFIGMSKEQIKDYWSTKVSDECFDEGKYTDSNVSYFQIFSFNCTQDGSNGSFAGHPAFVASFDTIKEKCTEHSTKFSIHNISIIKAQLKNAGYHFDNSLEAWINTNKKILWELEPGVTFQDGSTTDVYFISCKLYGKK